ncbi:MAG: alcohol dehydrogenase catalytic domain-containing protein [Candidatus Binataceae bacterium]|jgi:L-iditol 2-dehydrogenase
MGPAEILVRTRACGICTGNIMPWYPRRKARWCWGHKPVGIFEEVSRDTSGLRPGERVFVHHHAPWFQCHACRRREYVQCQTWRESRIVPGGMAEYFRVGAINMRDTLKLPESVADLDGVLVEPAACVVKSIRKSGLKAGESILVIGLGIMGMMHVLDRPEFDVQRCG